jgi:hypothetical protein
MQPDHERSGKFGNRGKIQKMAKKRVFLDECCAEEGLMKCFPRNPHIFVPKDLGVMGKDDLTVIDKAISRKCLIVTVNKDFVDYYVDHPFRKGKNGSFFYGLIFIKPSKVMSRQTQLEIALRDIDWNETRKHDDLVYVSAEGKTKHRRLCCPEHAAEFGADQTEWG